MPNPLFNFLNGISRGPLQNISGIMQAMQNPAEFVSRNIPGIPPEIRNDPNAILRWLQQNRGITNDQIQQAQSTASQIQGTGTIK